MVKQCKDRQNKKDISDLWRLGIKFRLGNKKTNSGTRVNMKLTKGVFHSKAILSIFILRVINGLVAFSFCKDSNKQHIFYEASKFKMVILPLNLHRNLCILRFFYIF